MLAVASGMTRTDADRGVSRRSNNAVTHLVKHFIAEGIGALIRCHGGGFQVQYGDVETTHILRKFHQNRNWSEMKQAFSH